MSNENEEMRLKGYALQISVQLPQDKDEALRVLNYARELVEWRQSVGVENVVRLTNR